MAALRCRTGFTMISNRAPMAEDAPFDVAVIGAGVVGTCSALALAKAGKRVVLIDRLPPGEGTSFGNAGLIAEYSTLPQMEPGVLSQIPKWLMDPLGPLSLRWSHVPRMLPWLVKMVLSARPEPFRKGADALRILTQGAVDKHWRWARESGCADLLVDKPLYYVYGSEAAFRKARPGMDLRRELGVPVKPLAPGEINAVEPALSPDYRWAYLIQLHAFCLNPGGLVKAHARSFQAFGGRVIETEVTGVSVDEGGVMLRLETGTIKAGQLVVAAGAFSARLAVKLGDSFPLDTERGYHTTIAEPGVKVENALLAGDLKFAITPMEMGLRLAGTVELAGLDEPPNYDRAKAIAKAASRVLPGLKTNGDGVTEWIGYRPTLPDTLPVIDRSPRNERVIYAFGHQHIGLTTAPQTARWVSALIQGRRPNEDISAFAADRF